MVSVLEVRNKVVAKAREGGQWSEALRDEIPRSWTLHGDVAILPPNAFTTKTAWSHDILMEVAHLLKVKTIARQTGSIGGEFRRPSLEILYGSDTIANKTENGIKYQWDMTKCMFSPGNISEKQRIANLNCKGQVVVDLFAGIGYFTLTYLIHAKAAFVYACEWNPEAVFWLKNNLRLNKVEGRCEVLEGDNKETCPKDVADRVNLGLIPSSEESWMVACAALKRSTGGVLHVHGNADANKQSAWIDHVMRTIPKHFAALYGEKMRWEVRLMGVVKVKSFGPKVHHLVADVLCRPQPQGPPEL